MKPSIPVAHLNNVSPDAIRWFIIGAYQAGASESEIVSLTNLSRYTIRYTIASFVRTGLPNIRTQRAPTTKRKTKSTTSYHYQQHLASLNNNAEDDEDELSESSSGEEEDDDSEDNNDGTIKKEEQNEGLLAWKHSLLLRRKGNSTATDTMDYVLYKGRKHEEKRLESWQKRQGTYRRTYHHRPPSPPDDILVPKSEPAYISSPPTSPPTGEAEETTPLPTTCRFGYWSQQDDKNLLRHILTRTGNWDKLDQIFEGKHSVADCIERWDVLQHYLIKELKKTGTSRW